MSACEEIDRTPLEYNALWLDVARSSTLKSVGTRGDDLSSEVAHLCKQCAHGFYLQVQTPIYASQPTSFADLLDPELNYMLV